MGMAAFCPELNTCYFVPIDEVAGQTMLYLRLVAAANNQQVAIRWAADYEFHGAIAQLGERSAGSRKVGGSNPPSSTS